MAEFVEDGKVVLIHYTLRDDDGAVIQSSRDGGPMPYLHGAGNLVPGLERQLFGSMSGAFHNDLIVSPEEGYGLREESSLEPIPRADLPDEMEPMVGMPLMAEAGDGELVTLWITAVHADHILVDLNHPLAGQTLHFDVEIVGIRDSTEEERAHGHPHGPDGTHGHSHDHDEGG